MALIKSHVSSKKEKRKITINSDVAKDIKEYCVWANVSENQFFEQAAKFIFNKDRDWKNKDKKHKKRSIRCRQYFFSIHKNIEIMDNDY